VGEIRAQATAGGADPIVTNLTHPHYTQVFESEHTDPASFEALRTEASDSVFGELLASVVALVRGAARSIPARCVNGSARLTGVERLRILPANASGVLRACSGRDSACT
jgi:hypothetical protein